MNISIFRVPPRSSVSEYRTLTSTDLHGQIYKISAFICVHPRPIIFYPIRVPPRSSASEYRTRTSTDLHGQIYKMSAFICVHPRPIIFYPIRVPPRLSASHNFYPIRVHPCPNIGRGQAQIYTDKYIKFPRSSAFIRVL